MTATRESSISTVQILAEDPDLATGLADERLRAAVNECAARLCEVAVGPWSPAEEIGDMRFGIGLLILDGMVVRRVGVAGRFGAELLGAGDLMNPWHREDSPTLPRIGKWRVLRPSRMAVLDSEFVVRARRYPEVLGELFTRALRRSRYVAVNLAIVHQPRIDVRLYMLFRELADRWGTVHQDGVHVRVELTHSMLAELVAARRPTVTKALGELAQRSVVIWTGEHWLLTGEPPAGLCDAGSESVPASPQLIDAYGPHPGPGWVPHYLPAERPAHRERTGPPRGAGL